MRQQGNRKVPSSEERKIVGIFLVRNEEVFLKQAIVNVSEFCDEIIVADNKSQDDTLKIARECAAVDSRVSVESIGHPSESHELIRKYAGSKTWVLGVDGDELYDPAGLKVFRQDLLSGLHDKSWVLFGNVLNCIELDKEMKWAEGHLAPPCRSMTKLYNFAAIDDWDHCPMERLHGGVIHFRDEYNASMRRNLWEDAGWEKAAFRCLHLCFLARSRFDKIRSDGTCCRGSPGEVNKTGLRFWLSKLFRTARGQSAADSDWKLEKYTLGPRVRKDVSGFFGRSVNE